MPTVTELQMADVTVGTGATAAAGDSVTVIGTVSSRAGQPTLDQATITLVGTRPAPIPFSLTTTVAASAMGAAGAAPG